MRPVLGIVALCALALGACAESPSAPSGETHQPQYIFGGVSPSDQTFAEDWPFAAALFVQSSTFSAFFCTGSVIGARWVVTAGHCTEDAKLHAGLGRTIRVGVGSRDWTSMRFIQAEALITSPGYSTAGGLPLNDIGLIRLAGDAGVVAAKLPTQGMTGISSVRVGGWGDTGIGASSERFRIITLSVQEQHDGLFLASSSTGAVCPGDSGGPALDAAGTLVAVNSLSAGACTGGTMSGHTIVFDQVAWITAETGITPPVADAAGPVVRNLVGDPVPVSAAGTITATIDDASTGNSSIAAALLQLDGGEPVEMDALDGAFDAAVEDASAAFDAPAEPGLYEACVIGVDAVGNIGAPACTLIAVYDPSAGFATGAGWIAAGDGGRAFFAFVSRYRKGADRPDGNTQFSFKAASLDFQSTSYDWLVVRGSGDAQFKGRGTIVGLDGEFGFMLWAGDHTGGDTFRIRIWNGDDESDVVYDDGVPQPLIAGNIVVNR